MVAVRLLSDVSGWQSLAGSDDMRAQRFTPTNMAGSDIVAVAP